MMLVFGVTAIAVSEGGSGAGVMGADALEATADLQLSFEWLDQQTYVLMAYAEDEEELYYMEEELEYYCGIFEEDLEYYRPLIIRPDSMATLESVSNNYYNRYKPGIYAFLRELQSGAPLYSADEILDELANAYTEIADALSECRALEYERLTEGEYQNENYSSSALVVVLTVFVLAFVPALGLLGVAIAGVVSENRRRKQEQPMPFAPPPEMLWQPPPPYGYEPKPPQYPEDIEGQ
jgi:hypothetical protein